MAIISPMADFNDGVACSDLVVHLSVDGIRVLSYAYLRGVSCRANWAKLLAEGTIGNGNYYCGVTSNVNSHSGKGFNSTYADGSSCNRVTTGNYPQVSVNFRLGVSGNHGVAAVIRDDNAIAPAMASIMLAVGVPIDGVELVEQTIRETNAREMPSLSHCPQPN